MELVKFSEYVLSLDDYSEALKSGSADLSKSAIATSSNTFTYEEERGETSFNFSWFTQMLDKNLDITWDDVKAQYLKRVMEIAAGKKLKVEEIYRAIQSSCEPYLSMKPFDLKDQATKKMLAATPSKLTGYIIDPNIAKYGLQNSVLINMQMPLASKLFTMKELRSVNVQPANGQKPIYLFKITDEPYFIKDGKVKLSKADREDRIMAEMGMYEILHDFNYGLCRVYDISQLDITNEQYRLLMSESEEKVTYRELVAFATDCGIETTEKRLDIKEVCCFYEVDSKSIFVNLKAQSNLMVSEYIQALSEAITSRTSPNPPQSKKLEAILTSIQTHAKFGVQLSPEHKVPIFTQESFIQAEAAISFATKASNFIYMGVCDSHSVEKNMYQGMTNEFSMEREDEVENFTMDL